MFDVQRFIKKVNLKNRQRKLNKKFEAEGMTEDVLHLQAEINKERYLYNIPDDDSILENDFSQ